MSASARSSIAPATSTRAGLAPLWAILGVGLVLRLLFLNGTGFHNDVAAFESWTLTLAHSAPWQFYGKSSFADYPPGYFLVLWVLAKIYAVIPGAAADASHGWALLRDLVKLPAIAMDLIDAALIYAIVRRYASQTVALLAAGFMALNPAAIYVSSYWGQIDSVSWGLVLLSLYLVLRAGSDSARTVPLLVWAWLAFAFSLLIKPQAATVGVLLLAYPFATADAAVRARRLRGTIAGVVAALVLAYAVALLFHPSANPVAAFGWLLSRYLFGSNVYPYTSVNAFNLYALKYPFWQPDTSPLYVFGFAVGSLALWGVALVAVSTALIVWRYLQRRDDRALLEGAMLCALAFFVLATRMHERYVYGAFLLSMPLIAFGRIGLWSSITLTVTMYLNLAYSLAYQTVVENKVPGVDATDLWPAISHPASLLNVALFFALGWLYLGTLGEPAAAPRAGGEEFAAALAALRARARGWFDPLEGIAAMTRRDWWLAGIFTLASFALCIMWVQYPAERYFDEVYYPRAGEEYIKHLNVSGWGPFEFTHPPFTKLLITASMLLFGGLHGLGNTGWGWRFLNVVVGALTVGLLYVFAKRLTSSTLFASLAAFMLLFDGFHFVQSRISTPEITVAFFSLLCLYAFYRLWIATQIARYPLWPPAYRAVAITMGIGTVVAVVAAWLLPAMAGPNSHAAESAMGLTFTTWARLVVAAYALCVFWLVARIVVAPRAARAARRTTYADGTALETGDAAVRVTPVREREGDLSRTLAADGTLTYATPAGTGVYRPDGTATLGDRTLRWTDGRVWWIALALSAAFLADSKWNGLLDIIIVWMILALVGAQRWLRRPALYGNPFGAPLDLAVASIYVAGGLVYTLSYIPYFTEGHGFIDMVAMQHGMYQYHATLVATHPYASKWWQWPFLLKPISYFWVDTRHLQSGPGAESACCVAEVLALPNPFVWWFGLATIPIVGWLAWRERNKGYALLVIAYLWHWLAWAGSPRLSFEYHFYPNLSMIVLANTIVLQRVWNWRPQQAHLALLPRYAVGAFALIVFLAFWYFYPVLAAVHIPWNQWHDRMWLQHWII